MSGESQLCSIWKWEHESAPSDLSPFAWRREIRSYLRPCEYRSNISLTFVWYKRSVEYYNVKHSGHTRKYFSKSFDYSSQLWPYVISDPPL